MNLVSIIDVGNEEQIVRVLNKDWVVDGILQISAFALRDNETYLSVNRPSIDSYADDVREFISGHPAYKMTDNSYQCAELNVGSVRDVSICFKQKMAGISVEVEPRSSHFKSHARQKASLRRGKPDRPKSVSYMQICTTSCAWSQWTCESSSVGCRESSVRSTIVT